MTPFPQQPCTHQHCLQGTSSSSNQRSGPRQSPAASRRGQHSHYRRVSGSPVHPKDLPAPLTGALVANRPVSASSLSSGLLHQLAPTYLANPDPCSTLTPALALQLLAHACHLLPSPHTAPMVSPESPHPGSRLEMALRREQVRTQQSHTDPGQTSTLASSLLTHSEVSPYCNTTIGFASLRPQQQENPGLCV